MPEHGLAGFPVGTLVGSQRDLLPQTGAMLHSAGFAFFFFFFLMLRSRCAPGFGGERADPQD